MQAEQLNETGSGKCPFTGKGTAAAGPTDDPRLSEPQCPFSAAPPK